MKRSFALLIAGGITAVLAVFTLVAILTTLAMPTEANLNPQPMPLPEATLVLPVGPNEAANFEALTVASAREEQLQSQIAQLEQAIAELDASSLAQLSELELELTGLQNQASHITNNIQALQANASALQQAIQDDGATVQNELDVLANTESQFRQQVDTLNAQLNATYNELTQRQAAAAAAALNAAGGHDDDDNHGRSERHDDDDDDDHDDDHDDEHEDDDDD